ncbi:MAG: beta-ketoacyl-ACP synthase II [Eggerthellaceae bacterium]|jgi:3-oxoacyl-[acyl-carrier-protein] synthase II|nr:beta-ketoacyl-ACP synthase II [Eggerthellaceae bacterium]MCH4221514.1 beta-ketoacyl-ACP synthase II [Eggerthellaceae bacterium]
MVRDNRESRRRVVITGMGALSPLGNTAEETWHAAREGVCGIAPITSYDTTGMKVTLAGEVKDLDVSAHLDKTQVRRQERFTQFALIAAKEAFAQSALNMADEEADRCGCIIASGIGGLDAIAREQMRGSERGFDRVSPYFIPRAIVNIAAGSVAIELGLKGICTCIATACAAGTNAIGESFHAIRDGYADVMVSGGTESCITPLAVGGFTTMRALSHADDPSRASIPFDAERSGFVIGEGSGILVLEEYEHAKARGANILGELVGYGATCDAHHVTAPDPDGSSAGRCMQIAIDDADLQPSDIDYVNAHGTATKMNDECETSAMHLAFDREGHTADVPVSSTKSMTGHLLGASGAVEAVLCACALRDGFIPPNINYRTADPACDLNIVANQGQAADLSYVMSNSFGFGGHNASIVLGKGLD